MGMGGVAGNLSQSTKKLSLEVKKSKKRPLVSSVSDIWMEVSLQLIMPMTIVK